MSVTNLLQIAIPVTLEDLPEYNGTFEDDLYTIYHDQLIGVAVDN